jgi:ParB-like chromosome segregation protein Spo0J
MSSKERILIPDIIIDKDKMREVNPGKVRELAESISEIGLLHPVTINSAKELKAGLHRLEACKSLGWESIPFISLDGLDALRQELVQLDENLIRNEGTQLERSGWLKRRKEIYEELYPETKQYSSEKQRKRREKIKEPAADSAAGYEQALGFVRDTAQKTSKAPRTIREDIQIAESLTDKTKELIKGTPVEDKKTDLLKMARMEEEEQEEIAEIIANGEVNTVKDAKKIAKRNRYTESAQDVAIATETYRLICGDFADVSKQLKDESIDVIVTDPPYAKEYLYLYELLAKEAARLLKPGGSLLAMAGHSYIPDLLNLMTPHLNYQWTVAYLLPGGQSAAMHHRCVNTFWKPVFWFVKGKYEGDWRGDVVKSDVNDNDKRFDDWGQSESGIARLVEAFTLPGEVVLDPFVGGGTTAVVCVRLGRQFIGIDIEQSKIDITLGRLKDGQ